MSGILYGLVVLVFGRAGGWQRGSRGVVHVRRRLQKRRLLFQPARTAIFGQGLGLGYPAGFQVPRPRSCSRAHRNIMQKFIPDKMRKIGKSLSFLIRDFYKLGILARDSREGCGGSVRCRHVFILSARLETVSLLAPIGNRRSWFGISSADKMLNSSLTSIGDADNEQNDI